MKARYVKFPRLGSDSNDLNIPLMFSPITDSDVAPPRERLSGPPTVEAYYGRRPQVSGRYLGD